MSKKNVTIKNVAELAGVSIATVSRMLNGNYPVSEKLKVKVSHAVAALEYYPNAVARTLKTNSTFAIGFLVSDISNQFFTAILRAVEDIVQPHGYNVISCSTDGLAQKEDAYLKLLCEKQVDGMVINVCGENNDYISKLSQKIPIVLTNRCINNKEFVGDFVGSDDFGGIKELTVHLLEQGHRKIGFINGSLKVSTGAERLNGFKAGMREYGIEVGHDYPFLRQNEFSGRYGHAAAKSLLEAGDKPTAMVIANNILTLGALSYIRDQGLEIPRDLSIVSFGDIFNRELLYVMPTISSFSLATIGNKVGELLLERMTRGEGIRNREIRYVTSLVQGNTVKPL